MPEDTPLSKIRQFFSGLNHIRAEWSLEISEETIWNRPYILFWVGKRNANTKENLQAFKQMALLLNALGCGSDIKKKHNYLESASITQGIRVPIDITNHGYCLYMHLNFATRERIDAFKWGVQIERENIFYRYITPSPLNIIKIREAISTELKPVFDDILEDPRLMGHSGLWVKYFDDQMQEVYVAFPWHPHIKEIIHKIRPFLNFNNYNKVLVHSKLNFRHLGFSTIHAKSHLTLYFSAPLQNGIPENINELKSNIRFGGYLLNKFIKERYDTLDGDNRLDRFG